jgi:hypothetical protein
MSKPWHLMTPAERLADRIAKNREIEQRAAARKAAETKAPAEVAGRQKAVRNMLDRFQQIKNSQGIDAAAEFVRDLKK